jgi:energy-converting hydrogenase B subunit D
MGWFQTGALLLVAVSAAGVVATRDPLRQAVAISFYGLQLALLFFLHQAPDVALSQIVVGAVALPLMILLALAKIHKEQEERERGDRERANGSAR